jgi:hypothetical protein
MFKLTKIDRSGGANAGSSDAGRPSAEGARPGSNSAQQPGARDRTQPDEFRLVPSGGVDLHPHLNHRVRVTGTWLVESMSSAAPGVASGSEVGGRGGDSSGRAAAAGQHAATIAPTLTVSSLTMVAATCQ